MALKPTPGVSCSFFLVAVLANFCGSFVFLMLGLWFFQSRRPFEPVFGHAFYTVCICGFIGCVAFGCLVSLLGAAAVLAAKRWQILLYAALISTCGVAMGAAGVASLFFHDQVRQIINVSLNETMSKHYGMPGRETITSSIDLLQSSMPCCGYILYNDWMNAHLYRNQTDRNGISVPLSCCLPRHMPDVNPRCNQGFPFPLAPAKLHQKGCLPLLESWYKEHSFLLGVVACTISAFCFLSCCTGLHYFRDVNSRRKVKEALLLSNPE